MQTIKKRIKRGDNEYIIQRDMIIKAKEKGMPEVEWVRVYAKPVRFLIEKYKRKYGKGGL